MFRKTFFTLALLVAGIPSVRAMDLFNNLTESADQGVTMSGNGSGNWKFNAEAFTTTPYYAKNLVSSVTLYLALNSFGSTGGTFDVAIYSNDTSGSPANKPGTLVANVATGQTASQIIPTSGAFVTFTPASVISLSDNTTYWVVLDASNYTGSKQIISAGTDSSAGLGVTTNNMLQKDNVGTWSDNFPPGGPSHMIMKVVPEPSTYALGGIATSTLGLMARRRRKSA